MGHPVYLGGDSGKPVNIYTVQTMAIHSMDGPEKYKVQVLSSTVTGDGSAYGFSYPQLFSFYQPVVKVGDNLSLRGFLSPLADNAFQHYRFRLDSVYNAGNIKVFRIAVTPHKKYEPLFSGHIDIMDGSWRIYAVHFQLLKQQQMQILDTLNIEQQYGLQDSVWVVKRVKLTPTVKLLGFDTRGSFVQVHRYNLHPAFEPGYFNNVVLAFDTTTNKKSLPYWDTARALIVQSDGLTDYHINDSLQGQSRRAYYLDSMDRIRNNPSWFSLFITGETFSRARKKRYISMPGIIDMVNYNTVEGWVVNIAPETRKYWNNGTYLNLLTNVRYGFSNRHFNAHIAGVYRFYRSLSAVRFSVGQRVLQFNNDQPITPRVNTINSLLYRSNFMKLYQARFASLGYDYDPGKFFAIKGTVDYQQRTPLVNTSFSSIGHPKGKDFTPNYPVELTDTSMVKNNALSATILLRWQPGTRYVQLPDRKASIGSPYPAFELSYTHGIPNLLGSDVNYGKWYLSATQSIDLKMKGVFSYKVFGGGFASRKKVFLPDYQHFSGNDGLFNSNYLGTLLMASFYKYSTTASVYGGASVEWHLNGLLSNKVPLLRKLNWFFIIGGNSLVLEGGNDYADIFFSIENIFKLVRIDFVQSFRSNSINRSGIKLNIPLVIGKREP
ncbi:hypothetical protein FLA_4236 [Filimonas lacunae]|nr:hypothetical protein FLA_4236 [Filimonas lacunae]